MSERVDAAAKAIGEQIVETSDELEADGRWEEARRLEAKAALAAADAVMFSPKAIEQAVLKLAAEEYYEPFADLDDHIQKIFRDAVRAVVAALRGEA